tara:strand:- start:784 stop:1425 length:642 start_codon:yes stop_codon:yes gene_type:complete
MSLTVSSGGGEFEVVPAGQHNAVCYQIIDAGTRDEQYKDQPAKKRHCVFIYWELPEAKMDDGRPFIVSKKYTLSLNENAALYKDLKTWRGKSFTTEELRGFDLNNILGISASLEVEHTEEGRARVVSVFKPDGGAKPSTTENEQVAFDLDVYCSKFSDSVSPEAEKMNDIFESLPTWLQGMIEESYEWLAAQKNAPAPKPVNFEDEQDDPLPF